MSRYASLPWITALRIGCTNPSIPLAESNPAPPAPVVLVIQSLFCRSSAIEIFQRLCRESMSLFTYCISDQPSGMSPSPSPLLVLRMFTVESHRRPSVRNSCSHIMQLSRMYDRTSPRP
jgi:hypothetical protein